MTNLYTCACPEIFFFLRFEIERRGCSRGSTRETKSVATFFLIYIYIFFEKRRTRKACCWCWSDVGDCYCCFRSLNVLLRCPDSFLLQPSPSLILLLSTRLPLLFFSFLFFFFLFFSSSSPSLFLSTLFPLSPYSRSPWVMSNLCVLYI